MSSELEEILRKLNETLGRKRSELNSKFEELDEQYENTRNPLKKRSIAEAGKEIRRKINFIDTIVSDLGKLSDEDEIRAYLDDLDLSYLDENEKKFNKSKVLKGVTAVALLIALGFGVKFGINKYNEHKNTLPKDPDKKNEDTANNDVKDIPTSAEDILMPNGEINQELLDDIREAYGQEAVDKILATYEEKDEKKSALDSLKEKYGEDVVNEILATLEETEEETQEANGYKTELTDINDEDQVYGRAEEITNDFDTLAPNQGVKIEDTADFLNYINGGVVNETSRESALFTVTQIETLMNKEMNYAVDMINKGESGYKPNTTVIDYGKFFLDGSLGQKLATQISLIRSAMILNPESSEKASYAADFTKLLMNSWYLNGNDEISAYSLETSGMKVFIDKLFLNTAMIAGAVKQDLTVKNPLTGEDITLEYIVGEINKADCPTELVADNGDIIPTYVNKFSYDMEGMLKEAVYNRIAYEENFGKTLK